MLQLFFDWNANLLLAKKLSNETELFLSHAKLPFPQLTQQSRALDVK